MPEAVRIIKVTDAVPGDPGGGEAGQVAITYSTGDVPPRTVFVDQAKDTTEERGRVIKEDLEAARATRRDFLDLP